MAALTTHGTGSLNVPADIAFTTAVIGIAAIIGYHSRNLLFEDAYIMMNYAANFADLGIWSFDGLTPSNGATSPLYVLLLALGSILGLDLETWAKLLGVIGMSMLGGVTYCFFRLVIGAKWLSFAGALAIITMPYFCSVFGMETFLLLSFQLAGLLAYTRRRPVIAGVLWGMACLTRLDTAMMLAVVALYSLVSREIRLFSRTVAAVLFFSCYRGSYILTWFSAHWFPTLFMPSKPNLRQVSGRHFGTAMSQPSRNTIRKPQLPQQCGPYG